METMRNTPLYLTFALLASAALLPVHRAHGAELRETLAKTYEYSPRLRAAREQYEVVTEQVPQALSGWRPTVSANLTRGRQKSEFEGRDATYDSTDNRSLSLSQPLFNGGDTVARTNSAKNTVKAEKQQLRFTEQGVLNDAVVAYMDVVTNASLADLARNNEKVLTEQLGATQSRLDVGEVTITDKSQAEARLSSAKSDRIQAEGNLVTANARYRSVVGEEPRDLKMPTQFPEIPKSLDEAIEITLAHNPALRASQFQERAAGSDVSSRQAALLPSLSINGTMQRDEGGASFGDNSLRRDTVALDLRVPIYQSGAEYSRIREAKNRLQQRKHNVNAARDEAIRQVTTAWEQLETTRAGLRSREDSIKAAEIALDGVKQELLYGSRTTLDVLDAEQELFSARVELVRAQRNEVVAVYNLLSAIGKGTATDLALDVKPYDAERAYRKVRYKVVGF